MTSLPHISVIIPFHRNSEYFDICLQSVRSQTYSDFEVVMINDFASRDCQLVAERFCRLDSRFKIIYSKDRHVAGPWFPRNLGIKASSGKLICFLDSDDLWLANKLHLHVRHHELHQLTLSTTDYSIINNTGNILNNYVSSPNAISYKSLLRCNKIATSTVMIDSFFAKQLFFRPVAYEDYLYWLDHPECLSIVPLH